MTFDLEARSKGQMEFFSYISKTMRDRDSVCIVDILEIIYWVSFSEMTFDPEPRSKGQMNFFSNISKLQEMDTPFVL